MAVVALVLALVTVHPAADEGMGTFQLNDGGSGSFVSADFAVHSGAIVHVLRTVYGAGALADELDPPR